MSIPVGVIADVASVAIGGITGGLIGHRLNNQVKTALIGAGGLTALLIAIVNCIKLDNLTVVALSLFAGCLAGALLNLDSKARDFIVKAVPKLIGNRTPKMNEEWLAAYCVTITLFCTSGTGMFGALTEGFTRNPEILFTKMVLDFFTSMVFATTLGVAVAFISIPQLAVLLMLYFTAGILYPVISPEQLKNFSAVSGLITLANGFCVLKLYPFKVINLLPAILLVFPLTKLVEAILS